MEHQVATEHVKNPLCFPFWRKHITLLRNNGMCLDQMAMETPHPNFSSEEELQCTATLTLIEKRVLLFEKE